MTQKIKLSTQDVAQKFMIEAVNARGVIVHLTDTYKTILEQHDYPDIIRQYIGEILLAAVMLIETIKHNSRLIIQFQSDVVLKMLVAQVNHAGQLRALAQWDRNASDQEMRSVFSSGQLVITIFQKDRAEPMQSIVSLQGGSVAQALAFYFMQSEQLPTHFAFAVKGEMASGMLLQKLPEKAEENSAWQTIVEKFKAIDARELLYDNNVSFLKHYFPNDDIRLFEAKKLVFHCGCTKEKMENAIYLLGEVEANLILKEKTEIVITCDYCNSHFAFDREKTETIFKNKPTRP